VLGFEPWDAKPTSYEPIANRIKATERRLRLPRRIRLQQRRQAAQEPRARFWVRPGVRGARRLDAPIPQPWLRARRPRTCT